MSADDSRTSADTTDNNGRTGMARSSNRADLDAEMDAIIAEHVATHHPGRLCPEGPDGRCSVPVGPMTDPDRPWLWLCGCLTNDGRAHRVGCPNFPEGRR